jgi:nucleotide-binding universal stress UspA family protein
VVKDSPKPRRLGSLSEACAFGDDVLRLGRPPAWRETKSDDREIRGVEMGAHLARHGINVEIKTTPAPNIDVGNAILSYFADFSATMIVMGGYGTRVWANSCSVG